MGVRMPGRRVAALTDQGLVSGTNFVAFLYCARELSTEHWGSVGFAYASVLFCQGFQRATVTIPMISFSPTVEDWKSNARIWAGLNTRLTFLCVLLACAVSLGASVLGQVWLSLSALMAALMVAPLFGMEFSRRSAIQEERFGKLVGMATAYACGIVLTLLFWPKSHGFLWAPPAAITVGAISASFVYAVGDFRRLLGCRRPSLSVDGYKQFGVWAILSHLGFSGYNFGIQGLLGAMAGPTALGVFHACRTLMQPVNTLIGAMDSIDKPRAARAYAQSGRPGLFAALRKAMIALLFLAGAYLIVMLVFARELLTLAYGTKYPEQGTVVGLWALVAALMALGQPLESGLYVIRRTREMFFARLVASVLSLACAAWLISTDGAAGALVAMAIGYGVTAILGGAFLRRNA